MWYKYATFFVGNLGIPCRFSIEIFIAVAEGDIFSSFDRFNLLILSLFPRMTRVVVKIT
jgi:hypothetical protein